VLRHNNQAFGLRAQRLYLSRWCHDDQATVVALRELFVYAPRSQGVRDKWRNPLQEFPVPRRKLGFAIPAHVKQADSAAVLDYLEPQCVIKAMPPQNSIIKLMSPESAQIHLH
jgi:hypothetical protein